MSATIHSHPNGDSRPKNRLALEKSPYLLQHAYNPVDWYPWGDEALETAKRENKPIFLSIGYSACHWCHVMERESFENDDIAKILKAHFVSIKVDREERPDIDEIYMTAVQMMTGQGGWPLTIFLLPDGRPFYGGTYFPPDNRYGRISFRSLITQLADAYQHRYAELEDVANHLTEELQTATCQRPLAAPTESIDASSLRKAALEDMQARFDHTNGGFGAAPKFPPHHALRLLLQVAENDSGEALSLLLPTLERMALGGIYDHIGGGFHRYATDAVWLLPHFEKMLYDNALLARVYAEAYRLTGKKSFKRIANEICDWVLRDMVDDGGGIHSALDADSEGVEGKYYVWTQDEMENLLGPTLGLAFCETYNILPAGNYREEATGHVTGTNIPYLSLGLTDLILPDSLAPEISDARKTLLQKRYERVPPGKDDKVITAWNGLMIGALALCGKVNDVPDYLVAAKRAAQFCLNNLRPNGRLLHRYARGEAAIPAFLDDYAFLADGLLDLFEATGENYWADEARKLADTLLNEFWDEEDGGFFFTGKDHEKLIARSKDLFDGALPSANGVAARVLARLGNYPGGEIYHHAAEVLLHNYRGVLHRAPNGTHSLLGAALLKHAPKVQKKGTTILSFIPHKTDFNVSAGEELSIPFTLSISPGYHVNANQTTHPHLIPTTATVTTTFAASVGPITYPEPSHEVFAGETLAVYSGIIEFSIPVKIPTNAIASTGAIGLTVHFQACTETMCLAPETVHAEVKIHLS